MWHLRHIIFFNVRLHTNLFGRDVTPYVEQVGMLWWHAWFSSFVAGRNSMQVDIYIAGFPCKAFSRLREKTDGVEDKEALPFYEVKNTMKEVRPKAGGSSRFYMQHFLSLSDGVGWGLPPWECIGDLPIHRSDHRTLDKRAAGLHHRAQGHWPETCSNNLSWCSVVTWTFFNVK